MLLARCVDSQGDFLETTGDEMAGTSLYIQLFRERLSYKGRKAYATMSKVNASNGVFSGCLIEPQGVSAWWKETAQTSA